MSELSSSETPVLDLLVRMTADSVEVSTLDVQSVMLVRLRRPGGQWRTRRLLRSEPGRRQRHGLDADDVRGVLAAIAPIVGTSRVTEATGRIVLAIGVAIEVVAEELADESSSAPSPE